MLNREKIVPYVLWSISGMILIGSIFGLLSGYQQIYYNDCQEYNCTLTLINDDNAECQIYCTNVIDGISINCSNIYDVFYPCVGSIELYKRKHDHLKCPSKSKDQVCYDSGRQLIRILSWILFVLSLLCVVIFLIIIIINERESKSIDFFGFKFTANDSGEKKRLLA